MSQVILTENEVRAVTSSRLAEKLGTDKDKVLSLSGKTIYIVATGKNFEQNCAPTLTKLRESNEVYIVDEAPKPKRRRSTPKKDPILDDGLVAGGDTVDISKYRKNTPVSDEGDNSE